MPENYTELIEYTLKCSEYTPIVLVVLPDYTTTSLCRKRLITEKFFSWVQNYSVNETPKVIKKKGEPIMWSFYPSVEYLKSIIENETIN